MPWPSSRKADARSARTPGLRRRERRPGDGSTKRSLVPGKTAGELRPEAQVSRPHRLLPWDVEIAWLVQKSAAGGADLRERDTRRHRDVEALGESSHRDPEGAGALAQGLGRRPQTAMAEKERDRAIRGQLRRRTGR